METTITTHHRSHYIHCPLCGRKVPHLNDHLGIELQDSVLNDIQRKNPQWSQELGACKRCLTGHKKSESHPGRLARLQKRLKNRLKRRNIANLDTSLHRYRKTLKIA